MRLLTPRLGGDCRMNYVGQRLKRREDERLPARPRRLRRRRAAPGYAAPRRGAEPARPRADPRASTWPPRAPAPASSTWSPSTTCRSWPAPSPCAWPSAARCAASCSARWPTTRSATSASRWPPSWPTTAIGAEDALGPGATSSTSPSPALVDARAAAEPGAALLFESRSGRTRSPPTPSPAATSTRPCAAPIWSCARPSTCSATPACPWRRAAPWPTGTRAAACSACGA